MERMSGALASTVEVEGQQQVSLKGPCKGLGKGFGRGDLDHQVVCDESAFVINLEGEGCE